MKKQQHLPAIATKMLTEAMTRLQLLENKFGFQYAIISRDHAVMEGPLAERVAIRARTPRNPGKEHGAVTKYLRPLIEPMQEDEIVCIPYEDFHPRSIYSSAHSLCTRLWGNGTFVVEATDTHLEVWRTCAAKNLSVKIHVNTEPMSEEVDDAV